MKQGDFVQDRTGKLNFIVVRRYKYADGNILVKVCPLNRGHVFKESDLKKVDTEWGNFTSKKVKEKFLQLTRKLGVAIC